MNMKSSKFNHGLTLVEVIIVLALIGLVIAGAFSLNFFGVSSFSGGSDQFANQADIRLTVDSLTKDIRFAKKIEIINYEGTEPTLSPYETLIYYDSDNNALVKKSTISEAVKYYYDGDSEPILFTKVSDDTINYNVNGNFGSKSFQIDSNILLLNASEDKIEFDDSSLDSGNAIIFTSPEFYRIQLLAPDIQLPEPDDYVNTPNMVTLIFNKPMLDPFNDFQIDNIVVTSSKVVSSDIAITTESRNSGMYTLIIVEINAATKDIKNGDAILVTLINSNAEKFDFELIYDNGTKQWNL